MKIVFDLTPIFDHLTGIERYSINISKAIIKAHPENEYILLFKNEVHYSFDSEIELQNVSYRIIPGCNKLIFIQWRLYKELRSINADYYIFLSFTSPILFRKQKQINAIHDLTCWDCPESIPLKMKYYYRLAYRVAVKRSWRIVTVSRFSQKRICEKYDLSEYQVPIIYDGLTDLFREDPHYNPKIKEKYKLSEEYLLSLSTIEPRKNIQLLIQAYKGLIDRGTALPDLVLAGREGWKLEDVVENIDVKIKKKIHFTGFIEDEDLAEIYREAELFIFPSKYEGFGLPVIEAMSQGTLVLSSDAASLPEVCGEYCIMFRSEDVESLQNSIVLCMTMSHDEKKTITTAGVQHARSFEWSNEAEKLADILK